MATIDAIRSITIQASTPGVPQAVGQLNDLTTAQNRVAASAQQLQTSMAMAQKLIDDNVTKLTALKTANDNAAGGFSGLASNAKDASRSFADSIENTLNLTNHLKLLALGAYAMSPAFRAITNAGVKEALGVIPPVAASAASSMLSFATPALSFFSRIALPIGATVAAWEGLNYVIGLGSGLLDQYAGAERKLYAPDVQSNLDKLTKFQGDTISPDQQQRAIELASKLAEAKQNISDFLRVQIDLTEPALRLQGAWVGIVGAIGDAAKAANSISSPVDGSWTAQALKLYSAAAALQGGRLGNYGTVPIGPGGDLLGKGDSLNTDADTAMRLARGRMSAGLVEKYPNSPVSGFVGRFSGDVRSFTDPPKPPPAPDNSTNAYDRQIQSIKDEISVLQLEADGAGKTSQAVNEMKIAHEANIAAMKAGITPTDAMRAQWKAYGDQVAALTIQINQAKVAQEEAFRGATMFMSPSDAAAATAAHQIDPTNWKAHVNDVGPQQAALNSNLAQAQSLADGFASAYTSSMMQGKTATEAMNSALLNLENSLIQMVTKNLVNQALGGLVPAGGGGLLGFLGSIFPGANAGNIGGTAGNLSPLYHGGGIIGADSPFGSRYVHPAYFDDAPRFHSGGIAGNEVPIVAQRGEGVFTPGQMRAMGGGTQVNVSVVNNHSGAAVDVQQQQRPDGRVDIVATVKDIMNTHVASGGIDGPMRARYGAQIRPRSR